jgi:hypothetical protein
MDHQSAEQAAFTVMSEAGHGQDISRRYNSLTSDEQRQVFTEMKSLQLNAETSKLFGNIELFDNNHDGLMDNALSTGKDGSTRAVYDNGNQRAHQSTNRTQGYMRAEATPSADENVRPVQADEDVRTVSSSPHRPAVGKAPNEMDRLENTSDRAVRRAGEIVLDETVRGVFQQGRHGPSTGDRIEKRLERESVYGAARVLDDVLHRH